MVSEDYKHLDGKLTDIRNDQTELRQDHASLSATYRVDSVYIKDTLKYLRNSVDALADQHAECPARQAHALGVMHNVSRKERWKTIALGVTIITTCLSSGAAVYQVVAAAANATVISKTPSNNAILQKQKTSNP